jgi:hypothetical protein
MPAAAREWNKEQKVNWRNQLSQTDISPTIPERGMRHAVRLSFRGIRAWVERKSSARSESSAARPLRHSNALCGIPLWEAKRGLQVEFVSCRLHLDVE